MTFVPKARSGRHYCDLEALARS